MIGTALASPTGYWSFAPTTPWIDGNHAVTVTVTDATGLSSAASAPLKFTVNTAPVLVTLDEVLDNVGSSTGLVAYRGSTDDASPQLKGTATPGATVELYDTHGLADALANKIGTVVADAAGRWTYTPTLDQGLHGIYAHVSGTAGIASTFAHDFTVTTSPAVVAPMFVTLGGVFDDTGSGILVGIVRSTGDASPQLKGTATPGATVELYDTHGIADAAASKLGTVVADGTGHWTYTPTLQQGLHGIYATVGGATGTASSDVRDFIVTTLPAFVTLDEVVDNVGISTGPVGYGESTDDASPQLKGTATPGATVDLYDGHGIADALADKIGTVVADGTGHWTYTPTLQQGLHGVYACVDATAGISNSSAHQFTVTTSSVVVTPVFVTLDGVFDDTGSGLLVAIVRSTGDASPQLKGTATPGATVDLYDTHGLADAPASKIGTVVADGTGHWTYTPTLQQGLHGVYACVDATAGIASSDVRDFIVTTSPAFVTLDEVLDNVGISTGPVGYGESTDDASPQLKGTATPGVTVDLYDSHGIADASADKIGTVIADATGHWTYTPTLDQGLHGIYAYVGGTAGVASTNAFDFFVDNSTLAAKNTANSTVASFDKLDLSGNGDNTLKLSLDDLLNLGRTDLYLRDGNTQLMVNGDQGDAVELSRLNGNWTSNGTATVAGEAYAVYQHSTVAAEVFIQHGVTAVLM